MKTQISKVVTSKVFSSGCRHCSGIGDMRKRIDIAGDPIPQLGGGSIPIQNSRVSSHNQRNSVQLREEEILIVRLSWEPKAQALQADSSSQHAT